MQQHWVSVDGLPPPNNYSHAVSFSGRAIAIAGQVALDREGRIVGRDDTQAQVRQVFENLKAALAAAGAALDSLVKLNIYLTDMSDLPVLRQVRDEYISLEHPPASTLVQVAGLVDPVFRVEIDALASM